LDTGWLGSGAGSIQLPTATGSLIWRETLLVKDKVAVVFGSWTSTSRKSLLPVFEQLNGLLYYPVRHEGEESSRNIFYTGATPNQQAIPAVRYLMGKEGGEVRRWVLLGTDDVYPRTTNRILDAYLGAAGVSPEDIMTIYTPFGYSDWRETIARIKGFGSAGKKTAVISTIGGDANTSFYKALAAQKVEAASIPVIAFSVGERELIGQDSKPLLGRGCMELFPVDRIATERGVRRDVEGLYRGSGRHHERPYGGDIDRL